MRRGYARIIKSVGDWKNLEARGGGIPALLQLCHPLGGGTGGQSPPRCHPGCPKMAQIENNTPFFLKISYLGPKKHCLGHNSAPKWT